MFNNLIESTSHAKEFKRRGSFLLFTTATYAVLLLLAGVASIYAYDAHLETQSTELEITFIPVAPPVADPPRNITHPASNPAPLGPRPIRPDLIDTTFNPNNIPDHIGTVASPIPPAPPGAVRGSVIYDPPAPSYTGPGVPGGTGNTPLVNIPDQPPPPPPRPNPTPSVPSVLKVSKGVLEGKAISLPKPNYPSMARQIRVQGPVTVQVLIDEYGKVVSAKAVSGHPLLIGEAVRAATQARFMPTKLSDQPVKVLGVITYNFVLP